MNNEPPASTKKIIYLLRMWHLSDNQNIHKNKLDSYLGTFFGMNHSTLRSYKKFFFESEILQENPKARHFFSINKENLNKKLLELHAFFFGWDGWNSFKFLETEEKKEK